MKKLLPIILLVFPLLLSAQFTITKTLTHDDLTREYNLYVPTSYTGDTAVPLVFNFHGFGSNAYEQEFYSAFSAVAADNNFIVAYPRGTLLEQSGAEPTAHFNVGGFTIGSTVDDVGFTSAMIDTISNEYNIDLDRVYSTGMSNGGYMSFLLACQLSDRIAAVASVTGSMSPSTYENCNPQHPTPILQIHGTDDATVPYAGAVWTRSIDDVMSYWVDYNNCNTTPSETDLPDIDMTDGSTATHFVYDGGDLNVTAEHYRIQNGAHTWPGAFLALGVTNQDFDASETIWEFFSRYDINGTITTSTQNTVVRSLRVSPNPTSDFIQIEGDITAPSNYQLFSTLGTLEFEGILQSSNQRIDLSNLPANMYFLKVGNQTYKILKTR